MQASWTNTESTSKQQSKGLWLPDRRNWSGNRKINSDKETERNLPAMKSRSDGERGWSGGKGCALNGREREREREREGRVYIGLGRKGGRLWNWKGWAFLKNERKERKDGGRGQGEGEKRMKELLWTEGERERERGGGGMPRAFHWTKTGVHSTWRFLIAGTYPRVPLRQTQHVPTSILIWFSKVQLPFLQNINIIFKALSFLFRCRFFIYFLAGSAFKNINR